jgi:hypothetical protein
LQILHLYQNHLQTLSKYKQNKNTSMFSQLNFLKNKNTRTGLSFFGTIRQFVMTLVILSILAQGLSILGYLPKIPYNNDIKANAATTCTNVIPNGAFTTDLTGWTATSGWIWNNGTAALATDALTNQTISQSISGYSNVGGTTTFTIELQPAEANNMTTFGAIMDISFGGIKYLTINNPIGTGNVTYTAANGATFTTSTVVRNALSNIVLTVPSTVTTAKSLEFKHVSGDDDWYIYNVATDVCNTAIDDTYTTTGTTPVTLTPLTGDTAGTTIKSINGVDLTPGTAQSIPVTGGTVTIDAAGVIKFTPTAGFTGDATFPYVIQDTAGNTATAVEKVTVAAAAACIAKPIYSTDFGASNPNPGVALPAGQTDFIYTAGPDYPTDGKYAIGSLNSYFVQPALWGGNQAWQKIADHTGNPNGDMMIINGANPGTAVFQKSVTLTTGYTT